jgi:hypothetical protein
MCHCAQHTFYFFHGSLQSISYSVVMDYIFTCISYSTLSFGLTFIFNSCIHLRYKTQTFSCSSSFFPLLLWWVGVHYGIYTGSCNVSNVSYMNSPPPPSSFCFQSF